MSKTSTQEIDLGAIAFRVMSEHGFVPEHHEALEITVKGFGAVDAEVRDLRPLLWSSIDNDESRDLDQIEVAEALVDGAIRILVGIADVDVYVAKGDPIDAHAKANTCSVYTGVRVFPMLPRGLSEDLTSLVEGKDRLALVIDFVVDREGGVSAGDVYRARVKNHARLTYDGVGTWLEGGEPPARVASDAHLRAQLLLQHEAAKRLKRQRHLRGALDLETIEARPLAKDGKAIGLSLSHKTAARDLIEDFMIAANGTMARFLEERGVSSIRRVVRSPERWARIVELAAGLGHVLPIEPSSRALAEMLSERRASAPESFADLSLAVVKLMGPGEYALERAGHDHVGHFGLAVQDYTHSTAPNRRFADLVTQRSVKAALGGARAYGDDELAEIAARCTAKENDARKVERTMRKVAAATLLRARIGETFQAVVTGLAPKGVFVRLLDPPAEGRVIKGEAGLDVGDHLEVILVATEPTKGFLDFVRK